MKHILRAVLGIFFCLTAGRAQVESLPAPVVSGNSFEILSNSRYSVHSGFTSSLPRQVLANILWAMNRVPNLGSYRELYVATPENVYLYDPVAHTLVVHRAGDRRYSSGSAFEVGIACERHEEAGYAIQAGLLAGIAFWDSAVANVVCCPMMYATNHANSNWNPLHPIKMVNVFGRATATGLRRTVQAQSSDSSLPPPRVTGPDTFEILLAELHQDTIFDPSPLPIEALSQILWAGYGVSPHTAMSRRGLTVPSAIANYYLTRKIYLVRDTGVHRYHNRLPPGTNLASSDHRLELVMAGDRRPQLRAACGRIPSTAPAYIVITVADTALNYSMQEAGFAGFQFLMQALQLGLDGCLTAPVTPAERAAIIAALGIPSTDLPAIVFACGAPATGLTEEATMPASDRSRIHITGTRPPLLIEFTTENTLPVQLTISDLVGRTIRSTTIVPLRPGRISWNWDGVTENGKRAAPGVYFCRAGTGQNRTTVRFLLTH